jgi:hypothetical protein
LVPTQLAACVAKTWNPFSVLLLFSAMRQL